MKSVPAALQAHLDTGTTTLCFCWKVTRRDGTVQGFTNHDKPLSFDSVTYEAFAGFEATEIQSSLGLNVDDLEAIGALSSSSLNEDDLAAGHYDGAEVVITRVNWADVSQRIVLMKGEIGEVRRKKTAFAAEVRSLSQRLNTPTGRTYQYGCDADLGDARCTVNLDAASLSKAGTVAAVSTAKRIFTVTGDAEDFASGYATGGKLVWATGANAGLTSEVRSHTKVGSTVTIELWQETPETVAVSDTLTLKAGCDKQMATCLDKFSNLANFRGFPHMPGNDYVQRYANSGDDLDGGSLYGN